MLEIIYLLTGLGIGTLAAWLIAKYKYAAESEKISDDELEERYVLREVYNVLQNQSDVQKADLEEREQEIRSIGNRLSAKEQEVFHLNDKLSSQEAALSKMQERFQTEFENIANRLLEEKSEKFTQQNRKQLGDILSPLREKIKEFEDGVEKRYRSETEDRISLKKEIEQLRDLNLQLSEDANNLVNALKGESKTQGDWGEFQLEMLLEKAGLNKEVHYETQLSFKDNDGKDKRPDFIINLPEGKHLIIDSKVSLTAYERYFNESESKKRKKHLKAHTDSLRSHVRDLSSKKYQNLYQINSPDYLLLFVPIEPAFALALQSDQKLFLDALDKNVVIVTPSTLLATLRTVSYIWKQEKQKRSVLEIARQSGLLYDRFCAFVDDLKAIGNKIDSTQISYHAAMNKLTDAKRYGDTLIGRAEKIKELGAKATKSLPKELLEIAEENDEGYNE